MDVSAEVWGLTIAVIAALVFFDLLVLQRKPHETTLREAGYATLGWTAVGLVFGAIVWFLGDHQHAGEYWSGYLLERTLSVDNVFVFVLILSYFAVPAVLQARALLWGVVIALVLRAIFILVGATMLEHFEWTVYLFGAILLYSAIALARSSDEEVEPAQNAGLRLMRRVIPVTNHFEGKKLITKIDGKRAATPLFAVLVVLGTTDLVFAVDSIPAIFSVTRETYLVFTANAFALLGMRPLAFLLAGIIDRFVYLKPALAVVLGLVGLKMIGTGFHFHVNTWLSLGIIALVLGVGVGASLLKTRGMPPLDADEPTPLGDTKDNADEGAIK